jgi:hypothetical protein
MNNSQPFRRSLFLANAIAAIASLSMPPMQMQEKIAALGPYVSRGKGQNKSGIGTNKGGHMAFVRAARKLSNKRR